MTHTCKCGATYADTPAGRLYHRQVQGHPPTADRSMQGSDEWRAAVERAERRGR